jgi:Flp pilus assembly protein TadD
LPAAAGTAAAVVAIVAIAVPMLGARHLTESQALFRAGDREGALDEAESAADLQPYDAAPRMQEAFVYEAMDPPRLGKAAAAARAATERESTNWETFYVLSRIQAQREGMLDSAARALRRARELDPYNPALSPAD